MIRPLALLPLALAACATRSAGDDPLAGRTAGTPVDCITLSPTSTPQVVDARTILYRDASAGRIYRTGPVDACPTLRPLSTLIFDNVQGAQLCRNDRFQVLLPGTTIPSAYCRLDRFTPFERPDG